jgi:hypothetical protein
MTHTFKTMILIACLTCAAAPLAAQDRDACDTTDEFHSILANAWDVLT